MPERNVFLHFINSALGHVCCYAASGELTHFSHQPLHLFSYKEPHHSRPSVPYESLLTAGGLGRSWGVGSYACVTGICVVMRIDAHCMDMDIQS